MLFMTRTILKSIHMLHSSTKIKQQHHTPCLKYLQNFSTRSCIKGLRCLTGATATESAIQQVPI